MFLIPRDGRIAAALTAQNDVMLPFKSQPRENAGIAVSIVSPTARLGPSIHVKGDIMGTDDLLILGSVEGTIQLDQRRLTVGTAAKLTADISAQDVVVYGFVRGNVRSTGLIDIKKTGSVIGNLTAMQVVIEDGAEFKGSFAIDWSSANEGSLHGASTGWGCEYEDDRHSATSGSASDCKTVSGELHEVRREKRS